MSLPPIGQLVLILLLFPLLVILLGEIILRLRRQDKKYAASVVIIRDLVLPLIAIFLIVTLIADLSWDSLTSKLFITFGIIIGLVALLGIINGLLFERDAGSKVPKLFLDLGRILIIFVGVALVLSLVWGYNLNNLITALGVSSIVIGLALQDTLGNLFNGITIINEKPFEVGDFIEVDEHTGKVVEVNWRAVRLLTRENDLIVLPHIKVAQSAIVNHSRPVRAWAQKINIGFAYETAPNRVKQVLMKTALATGGILPAPPPEIKVDAFADSAVQYEIEYYIADFGSWEEIKDEFMTKVWYAARRHDLHIPFPQLNIHREPQQALAEDKAISQDADLHYAFELLGIADVSAELVVSGLFFYEFGSGEYLIRSNARFEGLYFILEGETEITTLDRDADEVSLAKLHRGDFFTEVVPRGSRHNAISVIATEDTRVIYLSEEVLRRLVNRYPRLAERVEEATATRERQMKKLKVG